MGEKPPCALTPGKHISKSSEMAYSHGWVETVKEIRNERFFIIKLKLSLREEKERHRRAARILACVESDEFIL